MEMSGSALTTSYILFLNDTEDDYHFGCTATSRAIKMMIGRICPALKIVSVGVQEVWHEGDSERIAGLIRDAVEIFVNGEGTILGYEGRTGTQNLLKLVEIAEGFGKRVSLINHSCFPSFSPYETDECEAIYKRIYSRLHRCVVRDMRSLAILNRLGISNAKLGFDCSPLYVDRLYNEVPIALTKGTYVVLSGGISFEKHFDSFLATSVKPLQEVFGKKLVFLFSETKVKAADDERCLEKIAAFNRRRKNPIAVYKAKNVDEFITVIKNAAFQITGRFHHSVIAAMKGTKFLCLSTHSPKNEVFRDILGESYAPVESVRFSIVPLVKVMLSANWGKVSQAELVRLAKENFSEIKNKDGEKWVDILRLAEGTHPAVFEKYRNCNEGREIVLLASGPTLDKYVPVPGALHIGVNKVFYSDKADLDYLFIQDFIPSAQDDADAYRRGLCKKFYGAHYIVPGISDAHLEKAKAERYYFIDGGVGNSAWKCSRDISRMPLSAFSSVAHPAVQFALWTGAKRIYLVGCDTSLKGYASGMNYKDPSSNSLCIDNVLNGWRRIKEFADICYPETEIVSINPVGLRGLFRDVYTEAYLAEHGELKDVEVFSGKLGPRLATSAKKSLPAASSWLSGAVAQQGGETIESLWKVIRRRDGDNAVLRQSVDSLRTANDAKDRLIGQLRTANDGKNIALEKLREAASARLQVIDRLHVVTKAKDAALEKLRGATTQLRGNIKRQREAIAAKDAALGQLRSNIERQREAISAKDAALGQLRSNIERQREAIAVKDAALGQLRGNIKRQREAIAAKDAALEKLRGATTQLRGNVEKQREVIAAKDKMLAKQTAAIDSLSKDIVCKRRLLSQQQALINQVKGIIDA